MSIKKYVSYDTQFEELGFVGAAYDQAPQSVIKGTYQMVLPNPLI